MDYHKRKYPVLSETVFQSDTDVSESDWHLEYAESAVLTACEHTELNSEQQGLQQLKGAHIRPDVTRRLQQVRNQTPAHVILTLETTLHAYVLQHRHTALGLGILSI